LVIKSQSIFWPGARIRPETLRREPAEYAGRVAEEIARWPEWTDENRPRVDLFQTDSIVLITDTRACAQRPSFVLTGLDARIYLGCDTAQTPRSIARQLGNSIAEEEIHASLDSFRDALLMAEMDGHYLSLAVWRNRAMRVGAELDVNRKFTLYSKGQKKGELEAAPRR
jgi:hypothetical protein